MIDPNTLLAGASLVVAAATMVAAPFIGSRAAHKHAEAARDNAAAEMRRAVVSEREQASADWARFVDAQDRQIHHLTEQTAANATRIANAEIRAESDRVARITAESNFRKAAIWIRRAIEWINEQLPGANYPPLPPELDLDI
jgi:hypothetical protein